MNYSIVWLPIAASLLCVVIKIALAASGKQRLSWRGMPSGHAAALGALVACLVLGLPETTNALAVAAVFSTLYSSDLLLVYNVGPPARDKLPLGHSAWELVVGAAIGVATVLIYTHARELR